MGYDLAGAAGAMLIVGAYVLLQSQRWSSESLRYSLANAVGAALILVSLAADFNLGATIVECLWLAVSCYGVYRCLRR